MTKVQKLYLKIQDCLEEIAAIQKNCEHKIKTSTPKSDVGNYDRHGLSADRYWIEHYCMICGKKWEEEQK